MRRFILSKDPALQDTSDVIPLDRGHPGSVSPFIQAPDTLLECLLVVVHAHGGTLSRQAAIDGLPLVNNRLTPSLFRRAAKRAGFTSNVVRKQLDQLNPALFPAVLLLDGEEACVLLGWQDDAAVRDHLRRCRALLFCGQEDFGMVPVEAMAHGTPVIGLAQGGVLETVIPERTGVLFEKPEVEDLKLAIKKFETYDSKTHLEMRKSCIKQAEKFSKERFKKEIQYFIQTHSSSKRSEIQ